MKKIFSLGLVIALGAWIGWTNATEPNNPTESNASVNETPAGSESAVAAETPSATTVAKTTTAPSDEAWGHFAGQITVKGDVPANQPIDVQGHADQAVCLVDGKLPLDNKIVVGKNGELRDVYVMMYLDRGQAEPTPHPSYAGKKEKSVTIDNLKCRFVPHALFVRPGQTLTMKNSDPVGHNCHVVTFGNEENINLPPNSSIDVKLKENDRVPGEVKCDVHKWMDAVIMVRDNPYVAITDADGKFKIENVPAGNWKFQFWHKEIGYLKTLQVTGKEVGRRGEVEFAIAKDETLDLGNLVLPAEAFSK